MKTAISAKERISILLSSYKRQSNDIRLIPRVRLASG